MEKERISASAAVQKVNLQFRNPRRAAALIEERAAFGLIQAHAELMVVTRKTRGPDVITEHRDCEVPRWVWQAREQQSAASEFDWSADRYTAFRLAHSDVRHRAVERVDLFGIEFEIDGIAKQLPEPLGPNLFPQINETIPPGPTPRTSTYQAQSKVPPARRMLRKFLQLAKANGWLDRDGPDYRSMELLLPDYQAMCKKERPTEIKPYQHSAFNNWVGRFNRGEWPL